MLPRALLMCSDAKAIEAITQVLGELEISFETIPDPSGASGRLANQRFDPILVDCDNVPNATLVLETARRSSVNQASMTIAIVDGKAGVPTAFRLGARLVMTKPVSLEGARSTLRNAIAMQRKEADGKASAGASHSGVTPVHSQNFRPDRTMVSDARKSVAVQSFNPVVPQPGAHGAPPLPSANAGISLLPEAPSAPVKSPPRISLPEAAAPLWLGPTEASAKPSHSAGSREEHSSPRQSVSSPLFSTLDGPKRKSSPYLLGGVFMLLVAAGIYAAFLTLPSFHDAMLSQYQSLHAIIAGSSATPRPVPTPPQPVKSQNASTYTQPANAAIGPTASAAADTSALPATSSTSSPFAAGFAPAQAAPVTGFRGQDNKTNGTTPVLLPASAAQHKENASGLLLVPEDLADAHVSYRVRPIYPYAIRRKGIQGAVVMLASVNSTGSVDSVRVISGNAQLAESAVEAVKQWRYEPYYSNAQPVNFQTQITVRFQASSP